MERDISEIIEEISGKLKEKQNLSFDDIRKITIALEYLDEMARDILDILDDDVRLRREKFGVDCIEELYRGEDLLPPNLRTYKPNPNNIKELINERMKAIILHEYSRLHDRDTMEFVDGKITYNECIERTERYIALANELFPRS